MNAIVRAVEKAVAGVVISGFTLTAVGQGLVTTQQTLGITLPAKAFIGQPGVPNTFTNLIITNSIAAQTTNTLLNQPFLIIPGYDLGVELLLPGPGRSDQGSNAVVTANVSVDGTNWMNPALFQWNIKELGTNNSRFYTNIAAASFDSAYYFRLETIGNTDTNYLTNVVGRITRPKMPVFPPGLSYPSNIR